MSWNNRITKDKDGYAIREVYYDDDGTVAGWTEDDLTGYFDTRAELIKDLKLKLKDAKRFDVLDI